MKTEDIDKRIGMPDVDAEWEKFEREVIDKKTASNKSIIMWSLSIAASIALLAGIFLLGNATKEQADKTVAKVEQPAAPDSQEKVATDQKTEKPLEADFSSETKTVQETKTASDPKTVSETVQHPAPDLLATNTPSKTTEEKEDNGNKAVEESVKEEIVFSVVEQNPSFPGGNRALQEFIETNKKYPELAQEYGAKGRVIMTFMVDGIGQVSDIKVQRFLQMSYDTSRLGQETEEKQEQVKEQIAQQLGDECTRIISIMPRWSPGKMYGKTVNMRYVLPIQFP